MASQGKEEGGEAPGGLARGGALIPGVTRLYVKIPHERLGVLIGKDGSVVRTLSNLTQTRISVDEVNGVIIVEPLSPYTKAIDLLKAQEVVKAIGYGFSPERAFRLLDEEQMLVVIDLKQHVKPAENHLARIKGRIIGEDGRVRKNIEEMTGTYISVYENYVAIIGDYESANLAREAIMMLIEGRQHSTVYRYIDNAIRRFKRRKMASLWSREV